jgi:signal transduction histidine kinase
VRLAKISAESGGLQIATVVAFLALFVCLPLAVWLDMSNIAQTSAQLQSANVKSMINEIRSYYATNIVGRVKSHPTKSEVVHNYHEVPGAIPIPATLSLELAAIFQKSQDNIQYRFVSDLPFQDRSPHLLDAWELSALAQLRSNSAQELSDVSHEGAYIRYRIASPIVMEPVCVSCHNTHPQSPKKDWRVGDVRGMQEVIVQQPVVTNIWTFKYVLMYMVAGAAVGLWLVLQFRHQAARVSQANSRLQQFNDTLTDKNQALTQAYQAEETSRKAAEEAQQSARMALKDLQAAQAQLVQSEKMASLGLLVANVAHEINTPIGAIKSSGASIADTLDETLVNMSRLFDVLNFSERTLLNQLISQTKGVQEVVSMKQERTMAQELAKELQALGVDGALRKARLIVSFKAQSTALDYLPLLTHPESDVVLATAASIADVINNANNINRAVDRVSRIIFALKEFSGADKQLQMLPAHLYRGMEQVLSIYQLQLQEVEVVRRYEDMPPILCDEEELKQVWTHLILNALYAMGHKGAIMIGMRCVDNHAVIKIADFGSGIPSEYLDKIFDAFFTTRSSGEGSGMGLAIVKKIIEKHKGRIEVESKVGFGTMFSVYLPYA